MTSENNEGKKRFNKLTAAAQIAQLLAAAVNLLNLFLPSLFSDVIVNLCIPYCLLIG